jgi:hypothetical protein
MQFSQLLHIDTGGVSDKLSTELCNGRGSPARLSVATAATTSSTRQLSHVAITLSFSTEQVYIYKLYVATMNATAGPGVGEGSETGGIPPLPGLQSSAEVTFGGSYHPSTTALLPAGSSPLAGPYLELLGQAYIAGTVGSQTASGTLHFMAIYNRVCVYIFTYSSVCVCVCTSILYSIYLYVTYM